MRKEMGEVLVSFLLLPRARSAVATDLTKLEETFEVHPLQGDL